MENARKVSTSSAAQSCCAPAGKAGWLTPRNVMIGAIALGGAGGLFFGWNWLVAAGFASVLIGLLPCLVMCALGLCMSRMGKKENSATAAAVPAREAANTGTSAPVIAKADESASRSAKRAA